MTLTEADLVIVIGFAFRDSYINSIFENTMRLRKDLDIIYVNPLPIDQHPDGSMAPKFASEHPGFKHVKRGLALSEKPLELSTIRDQIF